MAQPNPIAADPVAATHPAAVAYEQLLAEIRAVPESELIPINIDVVTAVSTVLGVLPEIRALRPEIEAEWRRFDFDTFDKLEQYTLALHQAHALWRGASVPKTAVADMASELTSIRDLLLKNAEALATFHLVDGERLKECKTQPGYRPLATDVATLVEVIRERWSAVEGKSPLTLPQLNEYAGKAVELLTSIGLKEQAPAVIGDAATVRQKAFALFIKAYEDARRAVLYLRAKTGDGDDIAPSLYAGRTRRKPNGDEPVAPPPGAPAPNGSARDASAAPDGNQPVQFQNTAGLPIGNPFTS